MTLDDLYNECDWSEHDAALQEWLDSKQKKGNPEIEETLRGPLGEESRKQTRCLVLIYALHGCVEIGGLPEGFPEPSEDLANSARRLLGSVWTNMDKTWTKVSS